MTTNPKPVLLTADGYTLDRTMRLVPVEATPDIVSEIERSEDGHLPFDRHWENAVTAAPSPDPAVFAENDPSLYIAFSDDGDRIIFWTRSKQRADEQAEYTPGLRIDSFRAVKDSLTAGVDEKAHRFAGVEEPKPTPDTRRLCPFRDYAGNEIREGDRIRHPNGLEGTVVLNTSRKDDRQWRVIYDEDYGLSVMLSLQVSDRGQAVAVRNGSEATK